MPPPPNVEDDSRKKTVVKTVPVLMLVARQPSCPRLHTKGKEHLGERAAVPKHRQNLQSLLKLVMLIYPVSRMVASVSLENN